MGAIWKKTYDDEPLHLQGCTAQCALCKVREPFNSTERGTQFTILVDLIPPAWVYGTIVQKCATQKVAHHREIFCCGAWNLCWDHASCPTCPSLEKPICQSYHLNANMTSLLHLHDLQKTFEHVFRTTKLQNSTRWQKSCWKCGSIKRNALER